jgi:hypothetical protein
VVWERRRDMLKEGKVGKEIGGGRARTQFTPRGSRVIVVEPLLHRHRGNART